MPKRVKNTCVLVVTGMKVNGRAVPDVDYQRTEYVDGTFVESGRPAGAAPAATIGQLLAALSLPPAVVARPEHPSASAAASDLAPRHRRNGQKGGHRAQG